MTFIGTIKKTIQKIMSIETFKLVFLIACFFYTLPFTAIISEKIFKINVIWAFLIVVYDHFKGKKLRINKQDFLALGMILFAFLSTIINYKSNLYTNIIVIIYMVIQSLFMLLYRSDETKLEVIQDIKRFSTCEIILTFICAIASIGIYMIDLKMSIDNGYQETLIGVFEGRLWSIYGNPNTLGHIALASIIFSGILLEINKVMGGKSHKGFIYTNLIAQWICLLLSNSRSTIVAGGIVLVIYSLLRITLKNKSQEETVYKYMIKNKLSLFLKTCLTFIVVIVLSIALKYSMPVVSSLFNFLKTDKVLTFGDAKRSVERQSNGRLDASNGRFEIWSAGIKVFTEKPLFGVGMKNVNDMANKYMSDVTVKETPKLSENMHNIYIQILVAHGILALTMFLAYLVVNLIRALKYLLNNEVKNKEMYKLIEYNLLIVVGMCAINLFDSNLLYFFSLFIVPIFWVSICNLNRLINIDRKNADNKQDVLILIDSLAEGGAEKVLVDVVNNINKDKYNIEVKTIYNEGIYRKQLNEYIKYSSVIKKPNIWKKRIVNRLVKYLPSRIIYMLFINSSYDVEVAFLEFLATKVLTGSSSKAVKVAWLHTDIFEHEGSTSLFSSKKKLLKGYQNFDKIVCVSDATREKFCNETNLYQETITIYNPVNKESIINKSTANCDFVKSKDKFTIMTIGRLMEAKGYLRLCEVINELKNKYKNIEVIILGEGAERDKIETYIKENNLQENIKLFGFKENPYSYLKQADLFISCSYVEGFSLALAEAITLGIPVISTATAGPIDILENGEYGLLVENSNEGIYNGLDDILSGRCPIEKLKEKAESRKFFFDISKTIIDIEKVFDLRCKIDKSSELFCTVFTPTYNRADTLQKLYDSLKSQTYKNFEWLVIDDGSTDNTENLFAKWKDEKNGFNIRYIKIQNGGKQRAVNKALDVAKGKMFFIVDSDDYLPENSIQKIFGFEQTIKNFEGFAGVSGYKAYDLENCVGTKLNKEYVDCKNTQRQYYNLLGDKSEVYYTDLLKRYKFPEIPGEKFVSERVVWDKIAASDYKIRWFNEITYICEYLDGGLTNQGVDLYKKNPKGYLVFVRNMNKYNDLTVLQKMQNYYGYYDSVKAFKAKKDVAQDIGTTTFMINLAILAKKIKDIIKK